MNPAPLTVLVVDDSREDRLTLRRFLTSLVPDCYTITEADQGEQALAICLAARPDCVLLDYNLSDMVDHGLLAALRGVTDAPVVLLFDPGREDLAVEAFQDDVHDYLVKDSITPRRLHLTIQRAVAVDRRDRERDQKLAMLTTVLDSLPVGVSILDNEHKVIYVNPALEQIAHIRRASLLSGEYLTRQYLRPDGTPWHPEEFVSEQAFREQQPVADVEIGIHTETGEAVWISSSAVPIDAPDRLVVVVSADITQRKRAEAALHLSAERLQTLHTIDRAILMAETPERIATVVASRLQQIVSCDRVVVASYDREQQHIESLAITDVHPDRLIKGPYIPIEPADIHPPYALDQRWYVPDTDLAPALPPRAIKHRALGFRSLLHLPLVSEGQLLGLLRLGAETPDAFDEDSIVIAGEVADMLAIVLRSARLRAQLEQERARLAQRVAERTSELRMANDDLARAARLKDEFLANMSHELRTPLNAILGRTELLDEQIYGPLTARQQQAIHSITESAQHLLALINDILDLSKIETGKITLDIDTMDVEVVCQQSRRLVAESAAHKRIRFTTQLDPQVTVMQADARRIKQLLVNLLSNAVKFTPEGGQIGLEVQGDAKQQIVTFTVWDTGIGIAPEDQCRLFQPFVQIDSALNRQYAGTGLGLALVRRLAELHSGSVILESNSGVGSRFSVVLPWIRTAEWLGVSCTLETVALEPQSSLMAEERAARPLILLAEDHDENRQLLCDGLVSAGYTVIEARNGVEAVAMAEEQLPGLILMDIQMPVMDGLEAIRRVREAGLRNTPIIALTALAMPGDRERCLTAGANVYLAKPVSLRTLLPLITAQLRRAVNSDGA